MVNPEIQAFYERLLGKDANPDHEGRWRVECPFHDDKAPSMTIYLDSGGWICHACQERGGTIKFLAKFRDIDFFEAVKLMREEGLEGVMETCVSADHLVELERPEPPPLPPDLADLYHAALVKLPVYLKYWTDTRKISETTLTRCKVGFLEDITRYTFPVIEGRDTLNIRLYRPKGKPKVFSYSEGYGKPKLWPTYAYTPEEITRATRVILVEGESDCLTAIEYLLDDHTIVLTFGAANAYRKGYEHYFKGKQVIIVFDTDKPGRTGAMETAKNLFREARDIRIVELPFRNLEHNDLSDWIVKEGKDKEAFEAVVRGTPSFDINPIHRAAAEGVTEVMPSEGLLAEMIAWGVRVTPAPLVYHLASAIMVVGTACGQHRTLEISEVHSKRLNTWHLLLGRSGNRKSSAMNTHELVLTEALDRERQIPSDSTPETLPRLIASQDGWCWMDYEEFGRYLASGGADYMKGHRERLTELYDKNYYSRATQGGGTIEIRNAALSILAASTPDGARLTLADLKNGFWGRILLWPAPPYKDEEDEGYYGGSHSGKEVLVNKLRRIANDTRPVRMTLTPEAYREHKRFKDELGSRLETGDFLPESASMVTRYAQDYAYKLAAIYEVSIDPDADTVSLASMQWSLSVVKWIVYQLGVLLRSGLTYNQFDAGAKRILEIIERHEPEGASKSVITRAAHMKPRELDEVIVHLLDGEEIYEAARTHKGAGRPTVVYRILEREDDKK